MRDSKIVVHPFDMIEVTKCFINKTTNEHFTAELGGLVEEHLAEQYLQTISKNSQISIQAWFDTEGTFKTLFKGLVMKIWVDHEGGVCMLHATAITYTVLLDIKENIRTFQNEMQSYRDICEFIERKNDGAVFIFTDGNERTREMLVQYEETDWEFLKRLASRLHTVLIPDIENNNICLCFGIPHKADSFVADSSTYHVEKNIKDYLEKSQNQVSISESDTVTYVYETREIWDVCSLVSIDGRILLVYKMVSELKKNELIHTYYLMPQNGFSTRTVDNLKLIGVSLKGKIISVNNDKVKVQVDVDNDQTTKTAKWFSYATVFSSPDGTGWYAMPEKGDAVRLYFPNEFENDAYAVSAVHLQSSNARRSNPDIKTIWTIHDKEIEFSESAIKITNNAGMSIELDDIAGIKIESDKDITLRSGQCINIESGDLVDIQGMQGVGLKQQENQIGISDNIYEVAKGIFHK